MQQTLAQATMAEVIKDARLRARLSMRGLARRSGLSAAQISRIEAGEVERPVAETLVKLAKALDRDAQLLLVFAGHIGGARARQLLRQAIEALPEPGRAEQADALARLEAEDERERRLGEELAEAERALAQAQRDLDEARFEGARMAAEPLSERRQVRVRRDPVLGPTARSAAEGAAPSDVPGAVRRAANRQAGAPPRSVPTLR